VAFLADTNILLRLLQPEDPDYPLVRKALEVLLAEGEQPCYTSQNLIEFWNVCTRPIASNAFGLSVPEADRRASLIEGQFQFLADNKEVHAEWRRLVVSHAVTGVQVHDARLVAAMLVHGIDRLLTLNTRDFARYAGVTALHPREVAEAPPGRP
jgi:predicted nucleic acid-binding protein